MATSSRRQLESAPEPPGGSNPPTIDERRAEIINQIAALGLPLPGSLVERSTRCGNTGCRCHADPPQLHGPYLTWTRKVDK
jgi:hypothetical protein